MELAGVDLSEVSVRELVHMLDPETLQPGSCNADFKRSQAAVALTFQERRQLLDVLVDPPDGLWDLRRALLLDMARPGDKRLP